MGVIGLIGQALLLRKLNRLKQRTQNKLCRAAVLAGARVVAKAIKREIPSTWKDGRKAIGARARTNRATGITTGKAGAGVGISRARRSKMNAKLKPRGKRKGVGMGVNNFHWLLAGTDERHTGTKKSTSRVGGVKTVTMKSTGNTRRRTGRVKSSGIVQQAFRASSSAAQSAMTEKLRIGIMREAAKP